VTLVCLGAAAVLIVVFSSTLKNALPSPSLFDSDRLGASALIGAPTDAGAARRSLPLFAEQDSPQEMPALTFGNMADATLTLTLRDRYGHVYRASARREETATLQVPPGDYSVSLDGDNPHIRPNWGDATFRKFKSYHAAFGVGHVDTRVHLGE
jgi:hypothetical protein